MKKPVFILSLLLLTVSFVACGGNTKKTEAKSENSETMNAAVPEYTVAR